MAGNAEGRRESQDRITRMLRDAERLREEREALALRSWLPYNVLIPGAEAAAGVSETAGPQAQEGERAKAGPARGKQRAAGRASVTPPPQVYPEDMNRDGE